MNVFTKYIKINAYFKRSNQFMHFHTLKCRFNISKRFINNAFFMYITWMIVKHFRSLDCKHTVFVPKVFKYKFSHFHNSAKKYVTPQ